jgi:hypothetical protein
MTMPLPHRIWTACLSALHLDRFLAGELEADEAERVRQHLSQCSQCERAVAGLRTSREERLPPLRVVPLPARRRSPVPVAAALAGAAAAASVLLLVRPPATRLKGSGFSVTMYVAHDGTVRRAGPGDAVAPGDAIRFAVTAPVDVHVGILSLDARRQASIYFPAGGRAELVRAGTDVALPLGTRLDDSVGEEQVVALFCSSAMELEPLRASLERGELATVDGCQVTRWSFVKR